MHQIAIFFQNFPGEQAPASPNPAYAYAITFPESKKGSLKKGIGQNKKWKA